MTRAEAKLARIRAGQYTRSDFIIADAKDSDMGPSMTWTGPLRAKDGSWTRYRTRAEWLDQIQAVVEQDVVDIMLTSASNLEQLLHEREVFANSAVKPAIRANDTTDIWVMRGAAYAKASKPFRTASLPRATSGTPLPSPHTKLAGTDLGLYSITFNNDLDADRELLEAFADFRADCAANDFKYFLVEVFNPNVDTGIDPEILPHYINDCILRCLAGVTKADRPQFLKIAYNGPKALEELASFDPGLIVGVLVVGPARRATATNCWRRPSAMARGWPCSAARSTWRSPRST